jgi:hypothetical protein
VGIDWTGDRGPGTGGRRAADSFEQPPELAAAAAGLVAFDWDSMNEVFEEDEEVFVHPRDPHTRG